MLDENLEKRRERVEARLKSWRIPSRLPGYGYILDAADLTGRGHPVNVVLLIRVAQLHRCDPNKVYRALLKVEKTFRATPVGKDAKRRLGRPLLFWDLLFLLFPDVYPAAYYRNDRH